PAATGGETATVEHPGGGHAEPTVLGLTPPWFIAAAMVVVIAIILWKKVPSAIIHALDKKIDSIRVQLAEARQLRDEAEALRNEYQAKADAADVERQTML